MGGVASSGVVPGLPSLTMQLLRGCPCGTPHPIALRAVNTTICPNCGAPSAPPGAPRTEHAIVTGWRGVVGRAFIGIGAALAALAERVAP